MVKRIRLEIVDILIVLYISLEWVENHEKRRKKMKKCDKPCEVYSRVVGFFRPVQQWNAGKRSEYAERVMFKLEDKGKNDDKN